MHPLRRLLFERFTWLVIAACAAQVVVALVYYPGCVVIDEVTYHAMTRALVRTGSLTLDNGLDVISSPELEWEHARAVVGGPSEASGASRLVAQYPYGYAFLVAPLYAVLGQRAFVVLNTLAFYGTVLVTRSLAFDVLGKRALAVAAALVFALGTYVWEYSFGTWPHAVTLFLCMAAVLLSLRATNLPPALASTRQLAAGALVGAAVTMRLDAIFAMAAVVLVPAIVPSKHGKAVGPLAMGLLGSTPGLALLAVTNHVKFGSWQPLSYGPWHGAGSNTGLRTYLPLAVLGVASVAATHLLSSRAARLRRQHAVWAASAIVAAIAIALAIGPLRIIARRVVDGMWMIVFDLRHSNPNAVQRGLSHGPGGAMMYVGALKKAFVQSLPWLPLAVAAPFFSGIAEPRRRRLIALAVPVVVHVGVFGALAWHGGLCLNLRYLLPALPFAAVLATYGAYRLARRAPWVVRHLREFDAIVLIAVAVWLVSAVLFVYPSSLVVQARFLLDAPLVIAASLAVALVVAARRRGPGAPAFALALTLVAVVWAGLTELSYDAVAIFRARASNRKAAEMVMAHAPSSAFVFAEFPDLVSDAMENGNAIAEPARDGFAGVSAIVAEAARHGRPSYAVLTERSTARLRAASAGRLLVGEPLAEHRSFTLRRLEVVPSREP